MADFTWTDGLTLGFTSGVVAGVVNQAASIYRDRLSFKVDADRRQEERKQAELLRDEASHAAARSVYLPKIEAVRAWITYVWGRDFGLDVDYHGTQRKTPSVTDPAVAIELLDQVATGHPTKSIRVAARSLCDRVDGRHNMIAPGGVSEEPDEDDYRRWTRECDELIEAIHAPRPNA